MKKYSYTFSINKPCSESWDKMTASEQGKFCLSCQQEVIDFSKMSDEEIIRAIEKSTGNICGRAKESQLNRQMYISANVQRYYPVGTLLAGLIMLTILPGCDTERPKAISELSVSPTTKQQQLELKMITDTLVTLRGRVLTQFTGAPVTDAEVTVPGTAYKAKVNDSGSFEIEMPYTMLESEFTVSIHSIINEQTYGDVSIQSIREKQEQVFWVVDEVALEKESKKIVSIKCLDSSDLIIVGNIMVEKKEVSPFEYLTNPALYK